MKLTFLGTSSAAPTRRRNVAATALQFDQSSAWWLFDCGEGTQHQVQRSPLRLGRMERIFITHLHGDHVFGLPGLLASRSMQDNAETPVVLTGPDGLDSYLRTSFRVSGTHLGYSWSVDSIPVNAHADSRYPSPPTPLPSRERGGEGSMNDSHSRPDSPSSPDVRRTISTAANDFSRGSDTIYDFGHVRVDGARLDHGIVSFGYRIVERDRPGHVDAERLTAIGVPPGPVYSKLKNKETVTLPDGRTINGADFVEPDIRGRTVVICGDTSYSRSAVELARGADVLVHEATFAEEDRDLAGRAHHSTASDAARVAVEAGVRTLIITHVSPRYDSQPAGDEGRYATHKLLAEARAIFPETILAEDLWTYDVPVGVGDRI